jgi:hypothetical protein
LLVGLHNKIGYILEPVTGDIAGTQLDPLTVSTTRKFAIPLIGK